MSYNWMLVRGGSANPSSLKFTALMNKQSIAENELFRPEKQQPSIISAHTEDLIAIQDPFFFSKLKQKTIHYRGGFEPDGVRLKLWAKFDHLATKMRDRAMTVNLSLYPLLPGNVLRPVGSPKLCEGPDFDGLRGGSIVTKLNSDPDIVDYYKIINTDETNTGIMAASDLGHVGFSMFFRFMLEGEPVQHNGKDPTLWFHYDMGGNNFFHTIVRIGTDKSLKFFVRDNDVDFNFISAANKVIPGLWTTACLTYRFTGNVLTMSINNVPQTDSANETIPAPLEEQEDGIFIGAEAGGAIVGVEQPPSGRFVGRLDDVRFYTDLVFNRDHETNIWNNGRSICAIPVLTFNSATNDDMQLGNDATLWSKPLTKFAFSFWIYPTLGNDGINRLLARHGNTGYGFECDIDSTVAGQIFFTMRNVDNTQTFEANNGTTGSRLLFNKWNQIICSYDNSLGSANGRIYVNGELGSQTINFTDTINSSNNFELSGPSTDFHGQMRDFRWWSNDSFNTVEADDFWNTGAMPSMPDYWLKMNEGEGFPVDYITRTKTISAMDATWTMGSSPRPIEYGSLSVAGYARFNVTVDAGGFDSTGFDTTGFDTT